MKLSTLALSLAALGLHARAETPDPRRAFDFWIGEWSVQNRRLRPDGTWVDGDVTRARITPVCGGAGVLEEWAGPFRGGFMNGFSLRAFDPELEKWVLVLFWTTDGNGGFGRLSGRFRHGRGEFFTPSRGGSRTRYTFSDALPSTVRWDRATSEDGERCWTTDWIMEFTRTRPAEEVTQEELLAVDWTEGEVSPHPEARALDWLVGRWEGEETGADGAGREARLACKLLAKDCLVLDVRTTVGPDGDEHERLAVRGYESRAGAWGAWTLSERDTRLRRWRGSLEGHLALFERPAEDGTLQEVVVRLDADRARIEEALVPEDGGTPRLLCTTELRRVGD